MENQKRDKIPALFYKKYINKDSSEWVILLHGAGGSSAIWFKQIREYKKNFNLLLIDLRGHGKSKNIIRKEVRNKYTFDEISKEVIEVIDYLNIESAHFVGISLGTLIIRNIAENYPDRVKSMVMGGAIIRFNFKSNVLAFFGNSLKNLLPFIWLYKILAWIIMPKKRHKQSRIVFVNEAKKVAQKEFLRWMTLLSEVKPLMRFFREKDTEKPTLYLMGEEDYIFLPPVKNVVKKHKKSFLRILANSGHVCNIDQAELFNKISIEFIKKYKEFREKKELLIN